VYSVTASCPCGLEYSAEITVEALNPLPNINVNDTNICENIGHILINLPPEVDYYLNGEKQSNSIIISAEGSYALIARNQCEEKSFDFNVGVIPCDFTMYIPNAFTPNSDGRNDCYRIAASNIYHFHIRIFNRWGQEVFASTDPNFCWDGALNGSPLPQGVYTCRISFSDNELVPPQNILRNIILIR
jgi:gliding motility-associated-like protein